MTHLTDSPLLVQLLSETIDFITVEIGDSFETEPGVETQRPRHAVNYVFGGGTDGAICRDVSVPLSYLQSTGKSTCVEALDEQIEVQTSECYNKALDAFLAANPAVLKMEAFKGDRDEVNYHSLYEAGEGSLAEELSEFETELLDEIDVVLRVGAFFYNADNTGDNPLRGEDSVHLWSTGYVDGGFMVGPGPRGLSTELHSDHVGVGVSALSPLLREDNVPLLLAIEKFREKAVL